MRFAPVRLLIIDDQPTRREALAAGLRKALRDPVVRLCDRGAGMACIENEEWHVIILSGDSLVGNPEVVMRAKVRSRASEVKTQIVGLFASNASNNARAFLDSGGHVIFGASSMGLHVLIAAASRVAREQASSWAECSEVA